MFAIIVLIAVFVLIAIRQIGSIKLKIWQIMLAGAIVVFVTGQISPANALLSINLDVIFFLFGMFVICQALEQSGYLFHLSYKLFRHAKNSDQLILIILFGIGIASAILTNDSLAIVGTPVVLLLATKHRLSPKLLMFALAFAITIGGVMSPLGNPQNFLIAVNGNVQNPFVTFFRYLFIPTMINLFIAYLVLKFFFKEEFNKKSQIQEKEEKTDPKLAKICKYSLLLLISLIAIKIVAVSFFSFDFRLTYIAIVSALPIIIFSNKRFDVIKNIN